MTDAQQSRWPALWQRAALRTAILTCLESGPLHGYGVALALQTRGFGRPKGGSLYPILDELNMAGDIADEWEPGDGGPGRRVYRITAQGVERLHNERDEWLRLAVALGACDVPASKSERQTA